MIRFVHTADIHLGTENYGRIDAKTGMHTRLLDFALALDFCIETAISNDVDFFLFCGDAYKTSAPNPTQQKILVGALLRLNAARIPIVIIVGNHDNPASFGKVSSLELFKDLPLEGFHVVARPRTVKLETKSGPVAIVGIPWPMRGNIALTPRQAWCTKEYITSYMSQAIATIIDDESSRLDPAVPSILAAHLSVSTGLFSGSEKTALCGNDPVVLPSHLARQPFDYVALGHLHRHQDLNKGGQPPVVYAGSLERIDFGEREDKGFCLVTIEGKGSARYEFIKGPMRPFTAIDVHIVNAARATEELLEALTMHRLENAIVKITYHLPAGARDTVNIKAIQAACSSAMHVVSIVPVAQPRPREQRQAFKAGDDIATLLEAYFESKPALKSKKKELTQQALELYEEVREEAVTGTQE